MKRRDAGTTWMWAEAVDLLEQAERLHRQFFRLSGGTERPRWEPPIDVYASDREILVEVALPGVPAERVELILAPEELVIRGERRSRARPAAATIRRMEIPFGRFERRIGLPPGTWDLAAQDFTNGCLQLLLARR
jgi:HSP20 family molecular chaperone IbpA